MNILFISWDHSGKPHYKHMRDRGAFGDFDRNGLKEYHEAEAYWTGILALKIMGQCYNRDVSSIMLSDGWYSSRARRASSYLQRRDRGIYLALHFNAGGGDYGSVFYDGRSWPKNGPRVSGILTDKLGAALPELARFKALPAHSTGWTRNAFSTIKAAPHNLIGACLEPAFIDNPRHRSIFTEDGMDRIAEAVVSSVIEFNHTRGE